MPKVTLRPVDKFNDMILDNFTTAKGSMKTENFGKKIKMSRNIVYARLKNPLKMDLEELFYLCEALHIDRGKFVTQSLRKDWR